MAAFEPEQITYTKSILDTILKKSIYDVDETDITFVVTNRTECNIETLSNLKTNMQKEVFCYQFILKMVNFYYLITMYFLLIKGEFHFIDESPFIPEELLNNDVVRNEFNKYFIYITNNVKCTVIEQKLKLHTKQFFIINGTTESSLVNYVDKSITKTNILDLFELYDKTFNSCIILQNLLKIENISYDQFFDVIFYYINKNLTCKTQKYLTNLYDPMYNTRSMIINNDNSHDTHQKTPIKNSGGDACYGGEPISMEFNDNFKTSIIDKSWSDGYDLVSNKPQESLACKRYIVDIRKNNNTIMSMTVTSDYREEYKNNKIHFYIYRNFRFDVISIINKVYYCDLSLSIHSFAAYIFNTKFIYSELMDSMKDIFIKNDIIVDRTSKEEAMLYTACSRRVTCKISVSDEFKNMWRNGRQVSQRIINPVDTPIIYSLLSNGSKGIPPCIDNESDSVLCVDDKLSTSGNAIASFENKYLKYKMKYNMLKNKLK